MTLLTENTKGRAGSAFGNNARLLRTARLPSDLSTEARRERGRLAEYLHDDVCQVLSLAQIKLSVARQAEDPDERAGLVASAEELVKRANRSVRAMMLRMVHSPCSENSPVTARGIAEDIEQLYGIRVHLVDGGSMDTQSHDVLVQCLRELLVNVAKHAQTNEATVTIANTGSMATLVVADSGRGFAVDPLLSPRPVRGFGLASIRQKVRGLGGELRIASQPGKGSTVTVDIPAQPIVPYTAC